MELIFAAIIWLLLSACVATYAERLGRWGWLALIFSLVFSPLVGASLYLALGRTDERLRADIDADERHRIAVRANVAQAEEDAKQAAADAEQERQRRQSRDRRPR